MKLDFIKMQAQGNDYIYFDLRLNSLELDNLPEISRRLSSRHFGIGADGIVLIKSSDKADAKMEMYNADGSRGKMCGSALRSVIAYIDIDSRQKNYVVETDSGFKTGEVFIVAEQRVVEVNLGKPEFIQPDPVKVNGFSGYYVNIGNPHFVVFKDVLLGDEAAKFGPELENSVQFPEGANIEFVQIIDSGRAKMEVWERGSGITLACGTGSGAVAFCAINKYKMNSQLTIEMPGGEVILTLKDEFIYLKGIVDESFRGSVVI